jgi:hypothetical protein
MLNFQPSVLITNREFPNCNKHHERFKRQKGVPMKLLPHELKRLRQYALLTLRLSPDNKTEVTKKGIAEFTKDVLQTIHRKRQIKNVLLVLVETGKEEG